jgi:hypothetical protein
MTIEESNLFVEFLNLKLSKKIINDSRVMYVVPTAICEITYPRQQFKFDKSWDWLMPVVEKIENLGYGVTIGTGTFCLIQNDWKEDLTEIY